MTQKLTLPIEIGRRYLNRNGAVVTTEAAEGRIGVCWAKPHEPDDWPALSCPQGTLSLVALATGRVHADGRLNQYDLVADAPLEEGGTQ